VRSEWVGADECKRRSKHLQDVAKNKVYRATAIDSRRHFRGHADIRHGVTVQEDEPRSPEITLRIKQQTKELVKRANYLPDPIPEDQFWRGPVLRRNSLTR